MTSPSEWDRLVGHVIPDFQSQGDVPLQHDICAASVIPGELPTVVCRVYQRKSVTDGSTKRGARSTSKAIRSDAGRGERLKASPDPQVAHIVEREKINTRVP